MRYKFARACACVLYIITSVRLRAQQGLQELPKFWSWKSPKMARKHCTCRQIRSNRPFQIRWALEAASLEPLGAQIGCSRATRRSNWLLQSHRALQSALEIAQNRSSGSLKLLLGLAERLENARRRSKTIENARRRSENA